MDGPRAGGGGEQRAIQRVAAETAFSRYRRLVDLTVITTFALIVLGGVVRVSESGLGCGPGGSGTEGWPLCGGEAIPVFGDTAVIIEFSHRALAAVVVALIGLLAWRGHHLRRLATTRPPQTPGPDLPDRRSLRWPLRTAIGAGVLVLVQAGLGGLTVEKNLAEELVAAHLGLAMILIGLLIWMSVRARVELSADEGPTPERQPASRSAAVRGLKPFAAVAAVLLLCAIVAGGYVAGTEKEGVGEPGANVNGAHLACGEEFPTCLNGQALPFGESRLSDIHLTHRLFVYGATLAILILLAVAVARGSRARLLAVAGGLLFVQVLLGALNVWLGENAVLIIAHLITATLLWSTVLLIAYRLAWSPQPADAPSRPRAGQARPSAAAA